MRYLLDTNILIFILANDKENISALIQDIIDDFSNSLFVSSLSIVELVFLMKSNKIKSFVKEKETLLQILENQYYIQILQTKDEHINTYSKLELVSNHKDQIDHFIISQAICEKMTLISSDRKFRDYIPQKLDFVFNKR